MKKLLKGIVDFRERIRPGYKEAFAKLALEQKPDVLFIACSDSRVVPNLFASTDPGDLFVIRNVGNLIPPCGCGAEPQAEESEGAAIEFAIDRLNVSDVIICGHSECGATLEMLKGRENVSTRYLRKWLRHADASLELLLKTGGDPSLKKHNQLSQTNVLMQLKNLSTYPSAQKRIQEGKLRLHAWWFDIENAEVQAYDQGLGRFVVIDELNASKILQQLSRPGFSHVSI